MSGTMYTIIMVAIIALVTALLRFLPFLIFRSESNTPKALYYLGAVLPGAIMGMLVVYCFKSTVVLSWPYALPELIATAVVVGTYLWKKNSLISIGVGTVLYMVLVQFVFV